MHSHSRSWAAEEEKKVGKIGNSLEHEGQRQADRHRPTLGGGAWEAERVSRRERECLRTLMSVSKPQSSFLLLRLNRREGKPVDVRIQDCTRCILLVPMVRLKWDICRYIQTLSKSNLETAVSMLMQPCIGRRPVISYHLAQICHQSS